MLGNGGVKVGISASSVFQSFREFKIKNKMLVLFFLLAVHVSQLNI